MESEDGSLEDGEIVDYTPLERPIVPIANNKYSNGANVVSSDDASTASESEDSDSEPTLKPKRQKPNCQKYPFTSNKLINKFNVWSIGLEEEALADDLINCGVQNVNRSRDVETYDYQMKYRLGDQEGDQSIEQDDTNTRQSFLSSNKRRHGEVYKKRRHIRPRSADRHTNINKHFNSRTILELSVSDTDPPDQVAKDIISKLSEKNEQLIARIVDVLGTKKAIEVYNETKKIEDDGGMLIMNGSRRRTPGGVYLLLVKRDTDIPHEKIKKVFIDDKEMTQQFRKNRKKQFKTNIIKKSLLGENFSCRRSKKRRARKIVFTSKSADNLLPNLLTRGELELINSNEAEMNEGEHAVSNPPPSPATDCDNCETVNVQQPEVIAYDDDFLQFNTVDDDLECF